MNISFQNAVRHNLAGNEPHLLPQIILGKKSLIYRILLTILIIWHLNMVCIIIEILYEGKQYFNFHFTHEETGIHCSTFKAHVKSRLEF